MQKQIQLDDWQKEVLKTEGNLLLLSGRRVGKSEILCIDASEYAANHPDKSLLVISHTERQAYWLFEKIHAYIFEHYRKMICSGKDRPTKTQLKLTNNTIIRCLPTGLTGSGIRGIPADRIYPDELDYIEEAVWQAITPMLLTTGGCIRGGTTPNPSKEKGYVYHNMYKNPNYKVFNISTEEVIEKRPISETWTEQHRKAALEHLENEKKTMTKMAYAVEYLGQWVDQLKRFFSDELIERCCTLTRSEVKTRGELFLGVDIARLGDDACAYEVLRKSDDGRISQVESFTTRKKYTNETYDKILELDKTYNFRKIGIDAESGSLGVGILDFLLREEQVKRKTEALNNRGRLLDKDGTKKKTLMKEDMYQNLLALMEHGRIQLLDDDDVKLSLRSVQYDHEITPGHKTVNKVFSHVNSDIVEALIRAAWLAREAKDSNIWIKSIRI